MGYVHIERILKDLSLWDKKDQRLRQLSGGMKRRVLIAKALSHEPKILFLDEPTAGVDVELRRDMWMVVDKLRKTGVTIILTTHYIEEAEASPTLNNSNASGCLAFMLLYCFIKGVSFFAINWIDNKLK